MLSERTIYNDFLLFTEKHEAVLEKGYSALTQSEPNIYMSGYLRAAYLRQVAKNIGWLPSDASVFLNITT